jgi:hypothetical protein
MGIELYRRHNRAIAALQGGDFVGDGKVGRPKKDGTARKPRTPEQRAAQAEKMKLYWAKRRKVAKKSRA